jgi:hypothetical protein
MHNSCKTKKWLWFGIGCLVLLTISLILWFCVKPKSFTVDGVWTWVDGSDPGWQERRAGAYRNHDDEAKAHAPLAEKRDKDELYYSLAFASVNLPWLRRKIVVCPRGHVPRVPEWMEVEIVHDDTLSTNPNETFSSECILANLDKIPGLSEHFLSVNDDIFVTQPLEVGDLFSKKGKPLWSPHKQNYHPPSSLYESSLRAAAEWTKTPRHLLIGSSHTPNPLTKAIYSHLRKSLPRFSSLCEDFPLRTHGCPSVPHLVVNGASHLVEFRSPSFSFGYFEEGVFPREADLKHGVVCVNNLGPRTPQTKLDYLFGLLENHLTKTVELLGFPLNELTVEKLIHG